MNNFIFLAAQSTFQDPYNGADDWASRWSRFSGMGIQTAILGILTVFAVLIIIWGCLELFHYCFYTLPESRKHAPSEDKADNSADSTDASSEEYVTEATEETDDGELVAAIVAAITALRAEEAGATGTAPGAFRVVSFRRR